MLKLLDFCEGDRMSTSRNGDARRGDFAECDSWECEIEDFCATKKVKKESG